MRWTGWFVLLMMMSWSIGQQKGLPAASPILPETVARQHGLTRAWWSQVTLDRARARVRYVALDEDALFVVTDRALVHALDAQTGQTLWSQTVGKPEHPSLEPGVGRDLVAIVNGSILFVLNRFNGKLLWKTQVDGAPGAGPALSDEWAYVPLTTGMVVAYRLEPMTDPLKELGKIPKDLTPEEQAALEAMRREDLRLRQEYVPPLFCQSLGRALVQPLVTRQNEGEEYVAWTTDKGFLYVGRVPRQAEPRFTIRYRMGTTAPISVQPTYLPPDPKKPAEMGTILAASEDGYLYAVKENDGTVRWRFSAAEPIIESPVVIGQRVFVCTQLGGMFCLDAIRGVQLWWAPRLSRFVAASKERIYAVDTLQRLVVLNAQTGVQLDAIPVVDLPIRVVNNQTDRIYLATETGLVQCLHEAELAQPLVHYRRPPREPVKVETKQERIEEKLKGEPAEGKHAPGQAPARPKAGEEPGGPFGPPAAQREPDQPPAPAEPAAPAGPADNPFN